MDLDNRIEKMREEGQNNINVVNNFDENVNQINQEIGKLRKRRIPVIGTVFSMLYNFLFGRRIIYKRFELLEENIRSNNLQIQNQQHEIENYKNIIQNFFNSKKPNPYYSIDYFDFENHFRGSREYIQEVQRIYLPYFENRKHVLDLGCGRGEFTELLSLNNIGVTGVDVYKPYVEFMQKKKLNVKLCDAIEYLKAQKCVDGIFMGQVIEHIPIESVIEICHLAYDRLGEGDYLIMETPNPMCLAIYMESFYMDPSHNKPIHPRTLQYICQKAGFSSVEILFTPSSKYPCSIPELHVDGDGVDEFNATMKRVENMLFGSQDYAIIARK